MRAQSLRVLARFSVSAIRSAAARRWRRQSGASRKEVSVGRDTFQVWDGEEPIAEGVAGWTRGRTVGVALGVALASAVVALLVIGLLRPDQQFTIPGELHFLTVFLNTVFLCAAVEVRTTVPV